MKLIARKTTIVLNILGLYAALFAVSLPAFGQDEPFIVHDNQGPALTFAANRKTNLFGSIQSEECCFIYL